MNNQVHVEIYGQKYTLRGDGEEKYVNQLARYVDGKMQEVAKSAANLPPTKVALLAAINISDELFQLRQERDDRDRVIEKKTRDLIEGIEEQFENPQLY